MLNDIQDAINKNLPTQVGEALKKRLEQADAMERNTAIDKSTIASLQATVERLKSYEETSKAFAARELALVKSEQEFAIKKARLEVQQEMTATMLNTNKEIVLAVFANSHYKYKESQVKNNVIPGHNGSYPQTVTTTDVKTIETEGQPNG